MISSFRGYYRFLSNFYPAEVMLNEAIYPTVEHAFQAAKTLDWHARHRIRAASSPGAAKALGRKVHIRPGWETHKNDVMLMLLRQKFKGHFGDLLIATAPQELVEGNTWGDRYWGVCGGTGENHLGKLLMQVRGEIQP